MALVAALAAPLFVDWNSYKPQFEAEAARVVGAPVRVEGALDARLLPAPILRLHKLSVGNSKDVTKLRADKLDIEFSLGSLLRGEWRATQLALDGLALDVGVDKDGGVIAPSKGEFNFGVMAIDKFDLSGRVTLHDEAGGSEMGLEGLTFSGDVRSLGGNLRGEGSFLLRDKRQPFRLALSKASEGEPTRLRLDLDSSQAGAMSSSLDGTLTFKNRVPHFEGTLTLAAAGETPWRITARTALDPSGAAFTQGEAVYGAEATGAKLAGEGVFSFRPAKLRAKLMAPQLDFDRAFNETNKTPAELLTHALTALPVLPWPSQIEAAADRVTLAGQALNAVSIDLEGTKEAWGITKLAFGGPGDARLALSGRIQNGRKDSQQFSGPIDLKTSDAQGFADWTFGKADASRGARAPLHLVATMAVAKDSLALDGMKLDLGGSQIAGRIARKGKRIDATLQSPQVDVDGLADIVRRFSDWQSRGGFEMKADLDFAKAKILGREVMPLQAKLSSIEGQPNNRVFDLNVRRAALAPWLKPQQEVSDLSSRLSVSDDAFALENLSGRLGAVPVKGTLSLSRRGTQDITGAIETGALDVQAVTAAMLGADGRTESDPLAQGLLGWRGSVAVKAEEAALPGGMEAAAISGTVQGDGSSIVLHDMKMTFGGGAATLSAAIRRNPSETAIDASFKLESADASALKYRELQLPPGKASARMTLVTRGRSAAALRNALSGNGVLTVTDARLPALDVTAFDVAEKASGDPAAKNRMESLVAAALDRTPLAVASVEVPFTIRDARIHADPTVFQSDAARATISGSYDIPEDQGDLRIGLKAMAAAMKDAPDIQIFLRGTADRMTRDVDVAALSSWLSLRAIERETQRLDALEKLGALPPPKPAPESDPPAQSEQALPPADVRIPGVDPRKRKAAPHVPRVQPSPAAGAGLSPLPPPIDIKPAPGTVRPRRAPAATF